MTTARHKTTLIFTAGLQRGDGVVNTWQQRGALPKCAHLFPERGDQKWGTMAQSKRDTMTGALGNPQRHLALNHTKNVK